MTRDIDERLRARAKSWNAAQGAPPNLADIPLRRPARRKLLMLAAAAAVVIVASAAVVLPVVLRDRSTHRSGNETIVPWADPSQQLPVPVANYPSVRVAAPTGTRVCGAPDLRTTLTTTSPGTGGAVNIRVAFAQIAGTPCAMDELGPDYGLINASGKPIPVSETPGPERFAPVWLLVRPGQIVKAGVRWDQWCGRLDVQKVGLVVAVGHGRPAIHVAPRKVASPICRPESAIPSVRAGITPIPPEIYNKGTVGSLVARIHPPTRPVSGHVLTYTVTVTNPADTAVSLRACPYFSQTIGRDRDVVEPNTVNCARAPRAIAGHATITLAMELDTTNAPPGTQPLHWSFGANPPAGRDYNTIDINTTK